MRKDDNGIGTPCRGLDPFRIVGVLNLTHEMNFVKPEASRAVINEDQEPLRPTAFSREWKALRSAGYQNSVHIVGPSVCAPFAAYI